MCYYTTELLKTTVDGQSNIDFNPFSSRWRALPNKVRETTQTPSNSFILVHFSVICRSRDRSTVGGGTDYCWVWPLPHGCDRTSPDMGSPCVPSDGATGRWASWRLCGWLRPLAIASGSILPTGCGPGAGVAGVAGGGQSRQCPVPL